MIFAIATTTDSPVQLQNAFGTLTALYTAGAKNDNLKAAITRSAASFLVSRPPSSHPISEGGQILKATIVNLWKEREGDLHPEATGYEICPKFGKFGSYTEMKDNRRYWTEAFLATLLDPKVSLRLRMTLIEHATTLGLGQYIYPDSRFDTSASSWSTFDISWVYPDSKPKTAPQDQAMANMRAELDKLRQITGQSPSSNEAHPLNSELITENNELRRKLKEVSQTAAEYTQRALERVEIYRQIGGHPLDFFKIPYDDWKNSDKIAREKLVRKKYSDSVRNYHPDQHQQDDPIVAEMRAGEFNRRTLAKDFLLSHIADNQF